jgi:DNA-binding NarL/FixJ family response regulator
MAAGKTLDHTLLELRRCAARHRRAHRLVDAAALIARLVNGSRTVAIEERGGGIAFRLQSADGEPGFSLTCVLHHPPGATQLTNAEQAVAELLCEGRKLAQIARLRGVSTNTVKSQVRQIFRKLDVESRVTLVRKLCV